MDFIFIVLSTWGRRKKCWLVDSCLIPSYIREQETLAPYLKTNSKSCRKVKTEIHSILCFDCTFFFFTFSWCVFEAPALIRSVHEARAEAPVRHYLFMWQYYWFVFVILCLKIEPIHNCRVVCGTHEEGCDDYPTRTVPHKFHLALFCLRKTSTVVHYRVYSI